MKDFDLRKPAGGSRAGRRRGSNDGIFGTTLGGDDEPEALVALEERWQVGPMFCCLAPFRLRARNQTYIVPHVVFALVRIPLLPLFLCSATVPQKR